MVKHIYSSSDQEGIFVVADKKIIGFDKYYVGTLSDIIPVPLYSNLPQPENVTEGFRLIRKEDLYQALEKRTIELKRHMEDYQKELDNTETLLKFLDC